MTREETIRKTLDTVLWTRSASDDNKNILTDALIEALEQEPKTGYLSIDDVMSVFDDFMCGEVDEDGTNTFLEMLRDKAETEET